MASARQEAKDFARLAREMAAYADDFKGSWRVSQEGSVIKVSTIWLYKLPEGVVRLGPDCPPAVAALSVEVATDGLVTVVTVCGCNNGCCGDHAETVTAESGYRTLREYGHSTTSLTMTTTKHLGKVVVDGGSVVMRFAGDVSVHEIAIYLCSNVFPLVIAGSDPVHDHLAWNSGCGLGPSVSGPDDLKKNWDSRLTLGMPDKALWYIDVDKVVYSKDCPCLVCAQWLRDNNAETKDDGRGAASSPAVAATAPTTVEEMDDGSGASVSAVVSDARLGRSTAPAPAPAPPAPALAPPLPPWMSRGGGCEVSR